MKGSWCTDHSEHVHIEEVEEPESTRITMQNPFETIPDQRKIREVPQKMHIEEVEEPKSTRITMQNPFSGPFKTIAEHRKVRKLPRKMNLPKNLKSRKLRELPCKTRTRRPRPSRKYENCHPNWKCKHETIRITTNAGRNLRSNPAFFPYRKNPKN